MEADLVLLGAKLCGVPILMEVERAFVKAVSAYLRPALCDPPADARAVLKVTHEGTALLSGPRGPQKVRLNPLLTFEREIARLAGALSPEGTALHSACVLFQNRPLLFVAGSGGGKSSLSLASHRAGAAYVSDDMVTLHSGCITGLARSIRFKQHPQGAAKPGYLEGLDLDSFQVDLRYRPMTIPLFTKLDPTSDSVNLAESRPPAVVRVSRGTPRLVKLLSIDRAVILHEATLAGRGEYDGSLPPGPTYDLTWTDPNESFAQLARALEEEP